MRILRWLALASVVAFTGCDGGVVQRDAGEACNQLVDEWVDCLEVALYDSPDPYALDYAIKQTRGFCADANRLSGDAANEAAEFFDCQTVIYARNECLGPKQLADVAMEISENCFEPE